MLHQIFSISLALIVLCSTISFKVEKHFCGDALVDVSIFAQAQDCSGISMNTATYKKKSCCKNEITVIEGQNELIVKTVYDLEFEQQLFVYSFAYSYINLFEGLPQLVIPHKDYSPPNLVVDKQIMDQVFLI
ncbi:hypothetical protein [Pontimicrobium sp. SW4]|uniref:Uncharacterized protein n=1 Tax=Pontimicrobium sp. SW4 TaxID=3153519 RepID=A0AAU7BR15_9FLAO